MKYHLPHHHKKMYATYKCISNSLLNLNHTVLQGWENDALKLNHTVLQGCDNFVCTYRHADISTAM